MEFKSARKISKFFGARFVFLGIQHMYTDRPSFRRLWGFALHFPSEDTRVLLCVLSLYTKPIPICTYVCCTIKLIRDLGDWTLENAVLIQLPVISVKSVILTRQDDWLLKISISLSACDKASIVLNSLIGPRWIISSTIMFILPLVR